jgi:hypothetical protein
MEAAEAVVNFTRSLDMHRVQHTKYVGDGNSEVFMTIIGIRLFGRK